MKKHNQRGLSAIRLRRTAGFGLVEALLIIIAAGIVGFGGYYVWHSKNSTSATNQSKQAQTNDETEKWIMFDSKDGAYSLRLPDGWKFTYQDNDVLYSFGSSNMVFKEGQNAQVNKVSGGRGGLYGQSLLFLTYDTTANRSFDSYTRVGPASIKNMTGTKYLFVYPENDGIESQPEGTKSYAYYFIKNGHALYITYEVLTTDQNQIELVEKMLRTAEFK